MIYKTDKRKAVEELIDILDILENAQGEWFHVDPTFAPPHVIPYKVAYDRICDLLAGPLKRGFLEALLDQDLKRIWLNIRWRWIAIHRWWRESLRGHP